MKRILSIAILLVCIILSAAAKNVKVTIDGYTPKYEDSVSIIINEDIDHIMTIPVNEGHFNVQLKVDADAFIRIYEGGYLKNYPDRAWFILIPDSKHITVSTIDYSIKGSKMSKRLYECIYEACKHSPEGFHIDVFSDDKDAWAEARAREKAIRQSMMETQMDDIKRIVNDNKDSLIPLWILYSYASGSYEMRDLFVHMVKDDKKWASHPVGKKMIERYER